MAVYEINSLTIQKGTDFDASFTIFNDDNSPLGINSSFVGIAKLRKYPGAVKEYPFEVEIDEQESSVIISMANTVTSTLPSGRCYFDVLLTYGYADTTTKKFITGSIIVQDTSSL